MEKKLIVISKSLYILIFLALFLPSFTPSCVWNGGEAKQKDTCSANPDSISFTQDSLSDSSLVDTIVNSKETDSSMIASDNDCVQQPKEEGESFVDYIFKPDKENLSFIGFLVGSIYMAYIWIFALLIIWSGILRFRNKDEKLISIKSTIALICLILYQEDIFSIVWGFWIMLCLTSLVVTVNLIIKFKSRDAS